MQLTKVVTTTTVIPAKYQNFNNMEECMEWQLGNPHIRIVNVSTQTLKNFFMGDYTVTTVWYLPAQ
jgi:hypothetical protein